VRVWQRHAPSSRASSFRGATQGAYLNEGPTALGKPPYQVGPVTVVMRPQAAPEGRIHGCYVPADRLIVGPWHK
jgi:hypothetical protein